MEAEATFENAMNELEEIVRRLESGELSLDESMKCYEKGMMLARQCSRKLDEAEKRIEQLVQGEDGTTATEPLRLELEG